MTQEPQKEISKEILQYFQAIHRELNKFEFSSSKRANIAVPLFNIAIEHCISICVLEKEYLPSSMAALARPATEAYLRAMWVAYCVNVHISEHSDQSFRDYPITHFGLNRSLIPRLSDHF